MKRLLTLILLLSASVAYSAIPDDTQWEVRSTGNNNNGGGFSSANKGATGVDYSQQDSTQAFFSGSLSAVGTTALTDGTSTFLNTYLGNIIYIPGQGRYCITGFTSSATVTVDRNLGTFSSTDGYLGGGYLTLQASTSAVVNANTIWVKNGTYLTTTATTLPAGSAAKPITIAGYNSTHGDLESVYDFANFPTIQMNNATANILTFSNNYGIAKNLILDGGSGASKAAYGFFSNGYTNAIINCKVDRVNGTAIYMQSTGFVYRCYATRTTGSWGIRSDNGVVLYSVAVANSVPGLLNYGYAIFDNCISSGNTGAGFYSLSSVGGIKNSVLYGNTGSGIYLAALPTGSLIINNIISNNGAYGIQNAVTAISTFTAYNYNAFYSNTSGNYSGVAAGPNDVTLTGNPFSSTNTFQLNNTAGAGAACRAAGFPGTMPGGLSVGYQDIGAVQHQDSGGSGGTRTYIYAQ